MNRESLRALREIMFQVAATIMIPLTVAGMGWYYTRWQQNLNDLKTMIDLVSDDNAERRKYGVAMFEYLLKNDKVPVEFVAAQLDWLLASLVLHGATSGNPMAEAKVPRLRSRQGVGAISASSATRRSWFTARTTMRSSKTLRSTK